MPGNYSNYNDTQRDSDVVRMSWDWTLSPTKLNHFYAGGNNWRENHDPVQATIKSGINWKDKVCLGNVPDCSQNLLNLDFGDITGWGGRANKGSENTIYSFAELRKRGVRHDLAAKTAGSGHGPWRLADSPGLYIALPNAYFDSLGIPGLKVRS